MARRNYTDKTLKLLFATSGNQCAFPACTNFLIEDGVVLCDIAHIIPVGKNGPRAGESPVGDLNAPDNLVLFCLKHHKVVDDRPEEYTAETLRKIKETHAEAVRVKGNSYEITAADLEKVSSEFNSISIAGDMVDSQMVATQGNGNTTNVIIVQLGNSLGVDPAKSAEAAKQYEQEMAARVNKLSVQLQQASVDKETLIEALKDPSVAEFVRESYRAASLDDDPQRYKIIAETIRARIKGDGDIGERKDVAFAQVPEILRRLTTNQMKLIAAHYAATHLTVRESPSLDIIDKTLGQILNPLGEITYHDNDLSQIAGSGAGTVITFSQDKALERIKTQYQHLFTRPIPKESIERSTISETIKKDYLREAPEGYYLTQPLADITEKEKINPAFTGAQNLVSLVEPLKMNDEEVKQKLVSEAPSFNRIIQINDDTGLTSLSLTLPGMALAVAVLESCLGQSLARLWASYDDQKKFPLPS